MVEEIWKDIPGYPKEYLVSNLGRVKRLQFKCSRGRLYPTILSKVRVDQHGYCRVWVAKSNRLLHRLVALAFIPNPLSKPDINHKNGIKTDNNLTNLEWVTESENSIHSYKILGRKPSDYVFRKGSNHVMAKAIIQYDRNGTKIAEWGSIVDAAQSLNKSKKNIHECLKGRSYTAYGYKWAYA